MKTRLIPLLGNIKEFEWVKSIVIGVKSVEIVKLLNYNLKQIINESNYLLIICLKGVIVDNFLDTVVKFGLRLHWLDLNLSNVIQLIQRLLIKSTRCQLFIASVLDNDWIQRVQEIITPSYLSFCKGVAMYLSKQQVTQLFDKLIENFSDSLFAFDSLSWLMVKNQQCNDSIKHMSANFDWRISDIPEIKNWNSGYRVIEIIAFVDLEANLKLSLCNAFF
ncbi:MAG: hypothetical protein SWZ49_07415 [Cyanobacteriota bacterium]|nr:hypothetical protein [Cyanobacteriota bacterium]